MQDDDGGTLARPGLRFTAEPDVTRRYSPGKR